MGNNLLFSKIYKLESDDSIKIDPDEQLFEMVSMLKGKIKNWQILAPSKNKRVIYFEMEENNKAEFVEGSMKDLRELAKK